MLAAGFENIILPPEAVLSQFALAANAVLAAKVIAVPVLIAEETDCATVKLLLTVLTWTALVARTPKEVSPMVKAPEFT